MGTADTTLFTKYKNDDIIVIQIYVDDIILGSTNIFMCNEFSDSMRKEFEMSMMGELNFFVGLQIKQCDKGIHISQSKYCKEMIKNFDLESINLLTFPCLYLKS